MSKLQIESQHIKGRTYKLYNVNVKNGEKRNK